jgi:hypothetical protein
LHCSFVLAVVPVFRCCCCSLAICKKDHIAFTQ